jgi:hypothetical protein
MPTKPHKVGDKIQVSMSGGKIVEAIIKAIIDKTDGLHYQVDFGNERTALVRASQVVQE